MIIKDILIVLSNIQIKTYYVQLIGVSSVNITMAMVRILNTVSSSSFLVGLGIGVVTTATYNILFSKQVMEHVEEDDEDNDSAGESNESHLVPPSQLISPSINITLQHGYWTLLRHDILL